MNKNKMFRTLVALVLVFTLAGCGQTTPASDSSAPTQEEYDAAIALIESQSEALADIQKETDALKGEIDEMKAEASVSSAASSSSQASTLSVPEPTVPMSAPPSSAAPKAPASSTASSVPCANKQNVGTIFEGYTVTITDTKTPAVMALGTDWPITKLYFNDASGNALGSISGTAYNEIMKKYKVSKSGNGAWDAPGASGDWEYWFAEEFNSLRGLSGGSQGNGSNKTSGSGENSSGNLPKTDTDTSAAAMKIIELTNQERENEGVTTLNMDDSLMELAQTRAEEVSTLYSHERPDGTRVVNLGYGENIGGKSSASKQVESWMGSEGHRFNILRDRYSSIGVGCYQTPDGKLYWVQIFE